MTDATLDSALRGPRRRGLAVIAAFCAVFLFWGSWAPLAGGAVAPGRVVPDSGVKTVQHLEGGLIRALHVREGDRVEPGDPIATLGDVGARAEVDRLADRRRTRLAEAARLEAELMGADAVTFPPEIDPADPVAAAEARAFETGRAMAETRRRVLARRIEQLRSEIDGLAAQSEAAAERLALVEEDIAAKSALLDRGLLPRDEMLRLRREAAETRGRLGELAAAEAATRQRIGETELELAAVDAERADRAAARAAALRNELAEIEQSLAAGRDVLVRRVVLAPSAGVVANLRFPDAGGVVGPGEPILDIVPTGDLLLVDARVSPLDVDVVREGLEAQVRLPAFPGRQAPRIVGRVASVSPDAMPDEATGRPHFTARVEVPAGQLGGLALVPGMTAEVLIVTGERTLMGYLMEPIAAAVRRGLREV